MCLVIYSVVTHSKVKNMRKVGYPTSCGDGGILTDLSSTRIKAPGNLIHLTLAKNYHHQNHQYSSNLSK